MYLKLLSYGLIGVLSFAGAWGIQDNRYGLRIAEIETNQAKAIKKATEDAYAKTVTLQKAKDEALKAAQIRQSALARDAAASRDALVRLSYATDQALLNANTSHSACINDANNLAIVFGRCTTKLQGVAADADQLTSNIQTLTEAWPK